MIVHISWISLLEYNYFLGFMFRGRIEPICTGGSLQSNLHTTDLDRGWNDVGTRVRGRGGEGGRWPGDRWLINGHYQSVLSLCLLLVLKMLLFHLLPSALVAITRPDR